MKFCLKFLAVAFAAAFLTMNSIAADTAPATPSGDSPAGTWKWTQHGRDGASWDQSLKLAYAEGKLTGALLAAEAPWGQTPEVEITDGAFKDGLVTFSITREFNGNKFVIKYEGKLEGDTIKGSSEAPGRDGGAPRKRDWVATRVK